MKLGPKQEEFSELIKEHSSTLGISGWDPTSFNPSNLDNTVVFLETTPGGEFSAEPPEREFLGKIMDRHKASAQASAETIVQSQRNRRLAIRAEEVEQRGEDLRQSEEIRGEFTVEKPETVAKRLNDLILKDSKLLGKVITLGIERGDIESDFALNPRGPTRDAQLLSLANIIVDIQTLAKGGDERSITRLAELGGAAKARESETAPKISKEAAAVDALF